MNGANYRPEIDGLRSLAILPVVLYHASIPGFSGGFIGVDVFYVISGYLITSIILRELALERFTYASFYERRIRRIFPALFAVSTFCATVALVLFTPNDLLVFGKSLLLLALFSSNMFFYRHGLPDGYFGDSSNSQLLLHTWSLSVEEQFYVFFPLTLLLLVRFARRHLIHVLLLLALASFCLNVWATWHHPQFAFYVFLPRAWELLIGSLLSFRFIPAIRNPAAREVIGLSGLMLIGWSIVTYNKYTEFPGLAAAIPCIGAWLVIYATGSGPSFTKDVLSVKVLVALGLISYSLYLWHWPLLVIARYMSSDVLQPHEAAIVILVSLVTAFVSFRFIESPLRRSSPSTTRRKVIAVGLATSALSALVGFTMYVTHGLPDRFESSTELVIQRNIERRNDYLEVCSNWKTDIRKVSDINFCEFGTGLPKKILFFGDSHIQQLYPIVHTMFERGELENHGVIFAINQGCTPTEHLNRLPGPPFHCDSFSRFAMLRAEAADIDTVFIGFAAPVSWDLCPSIDGKCSGSISNTEMSQRVLDELATYIRRLHSIDKRVVVSLPFPIFYKSIPDLQDLNAIVGKFGLAGAPAELTSPIFRHDMVTLARGMGAEVFDPRISLCPDGRCITVRGGVSIYKDNSHLTSSGVVIIAADLENALRRTWSNRLDAVEAGSSN